MGKGDIGWIKEALIDIKEAIKSLKKDLEKTNACAINNSERIVSNEQRFSDHEFWHEQMRTIKRHADNLSRGQMALIIAGMNLFMFILFKFIN